MPLAPYTFSFMTFDDEPPMLVSSTPLDTATMVPVGSTIVVVFSEPVPGVDTTQLHGRQGATGSPGRSPRTSTRRPYTFTPSAALPAASLITVHAVGRDPRTSPRRERARADDVLVHDAVSFGADSTSPTRPLTAPADPRTSRARG